MPYYRNKTVWSDSSPSQVAAWHLFGRQVGALDGYPYSPALRAAGGVWTDDRLKAFIRDPAAFAPGTSMQFEGIESEAERRALLDFLFRNW